MQARVWNPFRDKQRDPPVWICPVCGEEQYDHWDFAEDGGVCGRCLALRRQEEERAMTLLELSVQYRAQARVLQERIRTLRQRQRGTEDRREQEQLQGRIWILAAIWRETRDQAVLLERYYERGYRRNGRYTL